MDCSTCKPVFQPAFQILLKWTFISDKLKVIRKTDKTGPEMERYSIPFLKQKEYYQVADVQTSNPRRLFRRLSDFLETMGYETNYDTDSVEITKDEIGNSGYVNATIEAVKTAVRVEEGQGGLSFTLFKTSLFRQYFFLIGILSLAAGIITLVLTGNAIVFGAGMLLTLLSFCLLFERKPGMIAYPVHVWVVGVGEIYRAELSESRGVAKGQQGLAQEQITSEITIRIAGESYPPVNLDELRQDIERLLIELESVNI
ncbi:MAG: hypothetical protein GX631_05570 [Dehalococcoidales bacterium]|nr:hypothetical protein [Dehalococcoidales bacterium]